MIMRRPLLFIIHFSLFVSTALFVSAALTGCGLIDVDVDTDARPVGSMTLGRDTLFAMVGEQFALEPVFEPDTISNKAVLFVSDNTDIVQVDGNLLTATAPGWVKMSCISASGNYIDTCHVCVLPRWEVSEYDYPDDMLVFASVSIGGKEPTDDMTVAALVGDEARAIGEWRTVAGRRCMVFRIFEQAPQLILFGYYDRRNHVFDYFPQTLDFDGDTHGSPLQPFTLMIDE